MQPPRPFRTILAALLFAVCAVIAQGQTIKSLGFNTTNGQVIANTAELTFTNESLFNGLRLNNASGYIFIPDNDGQKDIFFFDGGVDGPDATLARTNLGLGLPALTNTSNVAAMRALSGSTNTNHPYSGTVSVVGTNNTNTLTFSNGILQSVQ